MFGGKVEVQFSHHVQLQYSGCTDKARFLSLSLRALNRAISNSRPQLTRVTVVTIQITNVTFKLDCAPFVFVVFSNLISPFCNNHLYIRGCRTLLISIHTTPTWKCRKYFTYLSFKLICTITFKLEIKIEPVKVFRGFRSTYLHHKQGDCKRQLFHVPLNSTS